MNAMTQPLKTEAALRAALAAVNEQLAQRLHALPGGSADVQEVERLRAESAALVQMAERAAS